MNTEILISITKDGIKNICLIAETERECQQVMETYRKFEPEILEFIRAIKQEGGFQKEAQDHWGSLEENIDLKG